MKSKEWRSGKVRWFDDLKGEGVIRDTDGNSYFVHYSAIISNIPRKTLTKNRDVEFQLYVDSHFIQVDKIKELGAYK
jgi:cold shock CspA family protein